MQDSRAEARVASGEVSRAARVRRLAEAAARRPLATGPAFISDEAAEHHYREALVDPQAPPATRSAARLALAGLHVERGELSDAVELYQQNIWDGDRAPATFAGLAAAYRSLGREDLAEASLNHVRRQGGAAPRPRPARSLPTRRQAPWAGLQTRPGGERIGQAVMQRGGAEASGRAAGPTVLQVVGLSGALASFLAATAGRRTLVASTVLLPILLGLGIFVMAVMAAARPRVVEPPAPVPTATVAPAPTVAPTVAPTIAIPSVLTQPPAPARLVVAGVGQEGLSVRRTPSSNGDRIKVWREGTELADLGEESQQDGKSWRRVRDPDGQVGWAAAEFLKDPASPTSGAARPASSGPSYPSGGLGLSRQEWEQANGQPTRSGIFLEYEGGRLVVGFIESNVGHIERNWISPEAVSLEAAREAVRAYLPADATLVEAVDRGGDRVLDVYTSPSLARRFGPNSWNGGQPGTFAIKYRFRAAGDRQVSSAMFRLGDTAF